ncbi:hypothetical protein PVAND_016581 [Polypedilum vanderplanki]|uniref:UDP-glucuronosyltransferase n=1 Tax=Polypedilum vanderplanki TaxID=319348 RepID=A0A9J6BGQ1_POLVA|nr:hypothetical protein PVAND_016581 [Polypedilum vanderplanki]
MKSFSFLFFLIFFAIVKSEAVKNILFLNGVASPSHFIFNKVIAEGLAKRGYNVTFVSLDVDQESSKNLHYIHLENVYASIYNGSVFIDLLELSKESSLESIFSYYNYGILTCEGIGKSKGLEIIKNYPNDFKFDLVIHDYSCQPCLLGLLPKFNYPPLIGVSAFNNPSWTVDIVGGDKLGLTVKPFYGLHYNNDMNFIQRLHNGFINFVDSFYREYFVIPTTDKQIKKIFGKSTPYAGDLDKMTAIMLVNSNPVVDFAESLPPNIIEVGGLQIKEAKKLPDELNEFIEKGKKGTVLMSLGTNMRSDSLGETKIKSILEAFEYFSDYNFLWKFETSEMIENLPSNVMIKDWLPQNDILAHKSIKAFITHCGLLSTHEAIWHGVPMIAVPLFGDQHRNAFKSVSAGIAVKIDIHSVTTKKLKNAIYEILNSEKIKKNIQEKSKLFKDQPEKPLERALWWCEYVMRNPKPYHLRLPEVKLGLLGSHFLDIQFLILTLIFLLFIIIKKLHKKLYDFKINFEMQRKKNK